MKRRLFTLAAAVSLLLCLATAGLWVRSYWRMDELRIRLGSSPSGARYIKLYSSRGLLLLSSRRMVTVVPFRTHQYMVEHERRFVWVAQWPAPLSGWGDAKRQASAVVPTIAAGVYSSAAWGSWRYADVFIPHWMLLLFFGMAFYLALRPLSRRSLRHARTRAGLCPTCGYDLRATPDRCPECGNVPVCAVPRRVGG